MNNAIEQFAAIAKANMESHLVLFAKMTTQGFSGLEKLIDLNLATAKASLEDSSANAQKLLEAKDLSDLFARSAELRAPNTDKAIAYGRHFSGITANTRTELAKLTEAYSVEAKSKFVEFFEQTSQKVPPVAESAMAFLKLVMTNTSVGYEQFVQHANQGAETVEKNISSVVTEISRAPNKSSARSDRK